jgi:hypothetical protein
MRKSNANKPQRKSKPKIAPDRERDIISKIERINEELTVAPDSRKPYLINQRRRLEAMVIDPAYSLAFDISDEIERKKEERVTAFCSRKPYLENQIRRLEAMITPPKKQKALEDRRATIAKCLEGIRAHGAPVNHTQFIKWLRTEGVLTATRNPKTSTGHSKGLRSKGATAGTRDGRTIPVSDTTGRDILHSVFRLKSQRGRKPGRQNSD